jgi:hypothetical protein
MKKNLSIKQVINLGVNMIVMLFLYIAGVERIIKAPVLITALSRWGLLILLYFKKQTSAILFQQVN